MGKFEIEETAIEKLSELLKENDLTEIEIKEDKKSIRVSRSLQLENHSVSQIAPPSENQTIAKNEASITTQTGEAVLSPMVGIVYLSPEPGSANFIKPNDLVKEGDTLLLIEAMKTFNPLRAPRSGKIVEIKVSDRTPVEFGEELIVIE
ncbi:MAG: acetyl-CoA carboxylase biotin carboxyl carrier protein subunit [Pseudomonadota bacterium]|nr:acetyl-CoA carboxylase biotin carboxyl carrier protein subunit [Pseudomonadota bacterium]